VSATQRWVILLVVYGLFLAIGVSALAAVLGWAPNANEDFKKWAVGVLVADVAAAAIAVFKTQFQGSEARVYVNLIFENLKPTEVDLARCEYVIYDHERVVKKTGNAAFSMGPGGWQCDFSWSASASDTVEIRLAEHSGRLWRIRNFSPTTVSQQAMKVA
jgi:hypothetical protein